jgi:murein L,D-transpeptidase YcbB/YkuD
MAAFQQVLTEALSQPRWVCGEITVPVEALVAFYSQPPVPLWVAVGEDGVRAQRLRTALHNADADGLAPDPLLAHIEHYWGASDPRDAACLELLLTDAFRRYSGALQRGQVDVHLADPDWHLMPAAYDAAATLRSARTADEFDAVLRDLAPPQAGYQGLRQALARYRRLQHLGGWPVLPPGPVLEPGMTDARVPLLRARLHAEGDLAEPAAGEFYDADLAIAVRRFQVRHGLTGDGHVGERTYAALNVPVSARVAQLRRTLERWRWLPRHFGEHYILVNIPAFQLDVVEQGRSVLHMRVVTGAIDQPTPAFMATLGALRINPYWNVPPRIARDKLLPKQQNDPAYFTHRGIRVYTAQGRELDVHTIPWATLLPETFPYRLRQDPGPRNSMGRLAFVLPNPYDIFLHDTPEVALFARDRRAYSEGCVRIEQGLPLALHVLRHQREWDRARIEQAVATRQFQSVVVAEPLPVYVVYLTSWVDDAGAVHFADDVYGRDQVLARHYPDDAPD